MKSKPVVEELGPIKKLIAVVFILALLVAFGRAKGEENPLPKVSVEISIRNDGNVVYETGKYTFAVKKGETEPDTIHVWAGTDKLKYQIDVPSSTVLDGGGNDGYRTIKEQEKRDWRNEWEKVKKTVRLQTPPSYIDFEPETGREYELVAQTSETGPG